MLHHIAKLTNLDWIAPSNDWRREHGPFAGLCDALLRFAAKHAHKHAVNASLPIRNLSHALFAPIFSGSDLDHEVHDREVKIVMPEGKTGASRGRRMILITTCVAVLAGGGAAYWRWAQAAEGTHAARAPARAAVSVSVAVVGRQDVPIYLTGLGTVQGSLTVNIHSQVNGTRRKCCSPRVSRSRKATCWP